MSSADAMDRTHTRKTEFGSVISRRSGPPCRAENPAPRMNTVFASPSPFKECLRGTINASATGRRVPQPELATELAPETCKNGECGRAPRVVSFAEDG